MKSESLDANGLINRKSYISIKQSAFFKKLIPFIGLIVVLAFFAIVTGGKSISFINLKLIVLQAVIIMIGAIGLTFIISHGSMDLSLGGALSMSATFGALAGEYNPALTIPVCILVGIAFGLFVVGTHILLRVPVILVSFTVMFFGKGIVGTIAASRVITLPSEFNYMNTPVVYFIFLTVLFVIAYIIFEFTKVGKYNKAIGSNYTAAVMSGMPVNKYKMFAFLISGILIGICGFLSLLRSGGIVAASSSYGFDVIITLVLGGVSLTGGTNVKLRAVIIGGLILSILGNGLVILNVEPAFVQAVKGLIFLITVAISYERKSGEIIS